jgi:hypothetical protein
VRWQVFALFAALAVIWSIIVEVVTKAIGAPVFLNVILGMIGGAVIWFCLVLREQGR